MSMPYWIMAGFSVGATLAMIIIITVSVSQSRYESRVIDQRNRQKYPQLYK